MSGSRESNSADGGGPDRLPPGPHPAAAGFASPAGAAFTTPVV